MYIAQKDSFVMTPELRSQIDTIMERHEHDAKQILGILLETQDLIEYNYIPQEVAFYIAAKLPITISLIYDCLTFYASLSTKPRAKHPIQICNSIVCKVNDSDKLYTSLKKILGIDYDEITYDGRFSLEKVQCFGACDISPAVRINGVVYGHLDSEEKIRAVLEKYI